MAFKKPNNLDPMRPEPFSTVSEVAETYGIRQLLVEVSDLCLASIECGHYANSKCRKSLEILHEGLETLMEQAFPGEDLRAAENEA